MHDVHVLPSEDEVEDEVPLSADDNAKSKYVVCLGLSQLADQSCFPYNIDWNAYLMQFRGRKIMIYLYRRRHCACMLI